MTIDQVYDFTSVEIVALAEVDEKTGVAFFGTAWSGSLTRTARTAF